MDKAYLDYIDDNLPKGKIKKQKRQCNACGYIGYLLTCPECNGGMFVYHSKI